MRIFTTMGYPQPRPTRLMCAGGCLEFSYAVGSSSGSAVEELQIPSSRRVARVDLCRSCELGSVKDDRGSAVVLPSIIGRVKYHQASVTRME